MNEIETNIGEIKKIEIQSEAEVGHGGRRAWPRSIKKRVAELFAAGV